MEIFFWLYFFKSNLTTPNFFFLCFLVMVFPIRKKKQLVEVISFSINSHQSYCLIVEVVGNCKLLVVKRGGMWVCHLIFGWHEWRHYIKICLFIFNVKFFSLKQNYCLPLAFSTLCFSWSMVVIDSFCLLMSSNKHKIVSAYRILKTKILLGSVMVARSYETI